MVRTRTGALVSCVAASLAALVASSGRVEGQTPSDRVVMRSENSSVLQVWIVDPESGLAAFSGGDILAICRDEPDAHDLLDIQEVYEPQEIAQVFAAQGKEIGASLWDRAPIFSVPRLCQDLLSRDPPIATGTADLTATGRFPQNWSDPQGMTVYGLTAQGTMHTPDGETLRVNGH